MKRHEHSPTRHQSWDTVRMPLDHPIIAGGLLDVVLGHTFIVTASATNAWTASRCR
jgi:hypothetical protein